MAKGKKQAEAVTDVKKLNWDPEDPAERVPDRGLPETYGLWKEKDADLFEWTVDQLLNFMMGKVDPELTAGNPVLHWSVSDRGCAFVFRDGKKVNVDLREV